MPRGSVFLIGVLTLGGCEGLKVEEAKYKDVPAEQGRIVLYAEPFADVMPQVKVLKTANFDRFEYAFFSTSARHQSEIQLAEAGPGRLWRQSADTSAGDYVADWPYFKSRTVNLGVKGSSPGPVGAVSHQRFQHSDTECFSFLSLFTWAGSDSAGGGMRNRLTGYFCNKPNEALSEERIKSFIAGLGIRGEKEPEAELRAKYGTKPTATATTAPKASGHESAPPKVSVPGLYCHDPRTDVHYFAPSVRCARSDREISKSEYDRLEAAKAAKTATATPSVSAPSEPKPTEPPAKGTAEKRLEELKGLVDKGLISPEDAARKRKEILESL